MNFNEYKKIWFSADLHFGHKNILKFNPDTRPWKSVHEMDEALIEQWNKDVSDDDLVFILGDLSFDNVTNTNIILNRLNGSKVLVIGNHDHANMKDLGFRNKFLMTRDVLNVNLISPLTNKPQKVVMFHFPVFEWDQMHRGAYHLHGHVHGKPTGVPGRIMDVGYDVKGALFSWEEVCKIMENKPIREH